MPDSATTAELPPLERNAGPCGGRAELGFARDAAGRTYVRRQLVGYPYHVCRPLGFGGDPEGMATLYLQSCAGGIYRDDRLRERIVVEAGAAVHLTTQAATIVHGMDRGTARQEVLIEAAAETLVEVMPESFILFPQARFASAVRVQADETATVVLADSFSAHDPAGAGATFDWYHGDVIIEDRQGRVLARDRFRVSGAAVAAACPGVTGAFVTQGSLFVVHRRRPAAELVAALRTAAVAIDGVYAGASALPNDGGAWLRIMAADAVGLRSAMTAAWQSIRHLLTGRIPEPRRK
jgi:urease accessory protein